MKIFFPDNYKRLSHYFIQIGVISDNSVQQQELSRVMMCEIRTPRIKLT